ncbi:MAG: hypothetical protein Q6363_008165 [Candidatus Njordarchaeota archaeon]
MEKKEIVDAIFRAIKYITNNIDGFFEKKNICLEEIDIDSIEIPECVLNSFADEEDGDMDDAREEALKGIMLHCTWFQPHVPDKIIAIKCGLIPFWYGDDFYLALGGTGMDLSPKLEAYCMLAGDWIVRSSWLFKDFDYFAYVTSIETLKECISKVLSLAEKVHPALKEHFIEIFKTLANKSKSKKIKNIPKEFGWTK